MFDLMQGDLSANAHRPDRVEAEGKSPVSPILMPNQSSPSVRLATTGKLWLTDDLLFNYQRCHRRAFLDLHGNREQRDPPSDYVLKLRQDSYKHQVVVLGEQLIHQARYPMRDWIAGARATEALMQQGVERISHGVLLTLHQDGVYLVSCPDLLIRGSGHSKFGDWMYTPKEVKLGKRPKLDYQITATFHAYVLASVQDVWPETSWLMLRHRGGYPVDLVEMLPKMQDILQNCIQMFLSQQEPEVFITHSRCDLCHWFSHCYGLAKTDSHLSLLPGVTPSRYVYLQERQLTTLEHLAAAAPESLESLPGFGVPVAHRLIRQAQSTLQNRPLVKPFAPDPTPDPLLSAEELPTAPVELYFDIEAAPEQNLVYLHGVLVVNRQTQTETFHALLADRPQDEKEVWQEFLDLVWRYPTAPIFHFCPYEVQTVKRLAEYYGTSSGLIAPLVDRFVDLHERITRVAILPVESYALKPIARWLGFDWRDQDANGAQSIYWYAQWLATGDRTFLNAILRYNEDDCRATYQMKDWLVDFIQQNSG